MAELMNQALLIPILFLVLISPGMAQESTIFAKGELAPNVHHTGDVWLNHLAEGDENFDFNVVVATFAPGAKLDWHMHPAGQQIYVLEGAGLYQERGEPVQIVHKGDVILCEPGVEHWHGATPETGVVLFNITGNEPTEWLEPVSDEEFYSLEIPSSGIADAEQELIALSKEKWQWMADKDVDKLEPLFHEDSKFVHMGGTWGKERELDVIESGGIWYKDADVHEVVVEIFDDTAILWNRITLVAEVGGNEVTNEFTVTEVYQQLDDDWKMLNLTFSSVRDTHSIER